MHTITYNATDSLGRTYSITETVTVRDTAPPAFEVDGNAGNFDTVLELGATYNAKQIRNVVDKQQVLQSVTYDPSHGSINGIKPALGDYRVHYAATEHDGDHQTTIITERVTVRDTVPPAFEVFDGTDSHPSGDSNNITFDTVLELGERYHTKQIRNAVDKQRVQEAVYDGSGINGTRPALGSYFVNYEVREMGGDTLFRHVGETVEVRDTVPPTFEVGGSASDFDTVLELGERYDTKRIHNIADEQPTTTSVVDPSVINGTQPALGQYSITYAVTEDAGDRQAKTITETVTVRDTVPPTFNVDGHTADFAVAIEEGHVYNARTIHNVRDKQATTESIVAMKGPQAVDIDGTRPEAGQYAITYTVAETGGNRLEKTITERLTVTGSTPPVITLDGADPQTVELGAGYAELGASTDDGSHVKIDRSDFRDAVGSYAIRYDSTDAAGNRAAQVTRTVNVADMPQPQPLTMQVSKDLGVTTHSGNFVTDMTHGQTYSVAEITDIGNRARNDIVDKSTAFSSDQIRDGMNPPVGRHTVTYSVDERNSGRSVSIVETVVVAARAVDPPVPNPNPGGRPAITFDVSHDGITMDSNNFRTNLDEGDVYNEGQTFNLNHAPIGGQFTVVYSDNIADGFVPPVGQHTVTYTYNERGTARFAQIVETVVVAPVAVVNPDPAPDPDPVDPDPVDPAPVDPPVAPNPDPEGAGGAGNHGQQEPEKKKGGSSKDWAKKPTFGKHHLTHRQLVQDGFSFNNATVTIGDNFHTEWLRTSSVVGEENHVRMKAYAPDGFRYVTLSLGVPEIGKSAYAETAITINLDKDYGRDLIYSVSDITHEQKENLVDESATRAKVSQVYCNPSSNAKNCYAFDVWFTVSAPLSHDVMAITAVDEKRREQTTYVNDGVEFTGMSLLPSETKELWSDRNWITLTQDDRRFNIWTDDDGYKWEENGFGTFAQITHPDFERFQDGHSSVMTRLNSNFESMMSHEKQRAVLVWNGTAIQSGDGGHFSHDPDNRHSKLDDPKILELMRQQEIVALGIYNGTHYYYHDPSSDPGNTDIGGGD